MRYLPYLTSADTEITLEKLDKVAKTLSDKIKKIAKYFGIFLGWLVLNTLISLFFNRSRSLSLDAYRIINEGLRSVATQDILFVATLLFEDKLTCVISLAMIFVFGVAFFVRFLNLDGERFIDARNNKYAKYAQKSAQNQAYVVSYKQQVAFLA